MNNNLENNIMNSGNCSLQIIIRFEENFFKLNKECILEIDFCEIPYVVEFKKPEDVEYLYFYLPKEFVEKNKQNIFKVILKRSDKNYKFFEIIELHKDHLINSYAVLEIKVEDEKIILKDNINQEKFVQFIEEIGSKHQIKKTKKKPKKRKNNTYISSTDGLKEETVNTDSTIYNIRLDEKSREELCVKEGDVQYTSKKDIVDKLINLEEEKENNPNHIGIKHQIENCAEQKHSHIVNENIFSQSEIEERNLDADIHTLSDISDMFSKTNYKPLKSNIKREKEITSELDNNTHAFLNVVKEMTKHIKESQLRYNELEKAFRSGDIALNEKLVKLENENKCFKEKIANSEQEILVVKKELYIIRRLLIVENFLNKIRSNDRRYELSSYSELALLVFDFKEEAKDSFDTTFLQKIVFKNKDFMFFHKFFYEFYQDKETSLNIEKIFKLLEFGKKSYPLLQKLSDDSLSLETVKGNIEEDLFDLLNHYCSENY